MFLVLGTRRDSEQVTQDCDSGPLVSASAESFVRALDKLTFADVLHDGCIARLDVAPERGCRELATDDDGRLRIPCSANRENRRRRMVLLNLESSGTIHDNDFDM